VLLVSVGAAVDRRVIGAAYLSRAGGRAARPVRMLLLFGLGRAAPAGHQLLTVAAFSGLNTLDPLTDQN
jgi:hypothetical protein